MSKIVLVTGASRGIGLEAAKRFSKEGYKVIGTSRGDFNLGDLIGDESAISAQLDLMSKESIKNLFEDLKSEDLLPSVLVNNAGITKDQLFLRMKDEDWDDVIETNLNGLFRVTKAFIKPMIKNKFGRIINIGTNLVQNPVVPYHDYTIAKAALLGLTRTFAKDLGPSGITVNMLSGGLLKVTDASSATPDFVFDAIAEMTPLQKVTTIEDFSDAALFFASNQSRSITGQNLTVDGGLTFN